MSCLKVLTSQEREKFLELYTIENFQEWLKSKGNQARPNYSMLKSFKANCFCEVINNITNVIKDNYINEED